MAKNNKKTPIVFLLIIIMLLSVAYAKIGAIDLIINGKANASSPSGVFIREVSLLENDGAIENQLTFSGSTLFTDAKLATDNINSFITYQVHIRNNMLYEVGLKNVLQDIIEGMDFNKNENILVEFFDENNESLSIGSQIKPQKELTIKVKFSYQDDVTLNDLNNENFNVLKSSIVFDFDNIDEHS